MDELQIKPSRRSPKNRGFTLIELLVVVAIIALLIAILLPSLGRARDNAKTVGCLANLKALGLCSVTYNSDFGGFMTPGYYATLTAPRTSVESWSTIYTYLKYIPQNVPIPNPTNPPTAEPATISIRTTMYCPMGLADVAGSTTIADFKDANGLRPRFDSSQTFKTPANTWYGINSLSFDPAHISPARRIPNDHSLPSGENDIWLSKVTLIPNPGKVAYIYDGMWSNLDTYLTRLFPRHKMYTATNIVFCDGHAESELRSLLPQPADTGDMHSNGNSSDQTCAQDLNARYPIVKWRLDQF